MDDVALDGDEASVFRALADPTRRQILEDLRDGELTAGEIAANFPISGPSVSRHLGLLRAAGLIQERREANKIYYALVAERLALCVGRHRELGASHRGRVGHPGRRRHRRLHSAAGHRILGHGAGRGPALSR
jgi:DNA-binding transcriptional ArsR family regulator